MSDTFEADLRALWQEYPSDDDVFRDLHQHDFAGNIRVGNFLSSRDKYKEASNFFYRSYLINEQSHDALLAFLLAQLKAGVAIDNENIARLESLDSGFALFFKAKQLLATSQPSPADVIKTLGDAYESFPSGSEVDWIMLRAFQQINRLRNLESRSRVVRPQDVIPRRIFFYWDDNPPDEVRENLDYHRSLGAFDVELFDRHMALDFLRAYYGSHTVTLFSKLRHPSEESDFFRFHAIYALGGYYLDTDDQIISTDRFFRAFGAPAEAVFVCSASGPVHSAFFGAVRGSPVIAECIRILIYNCFLEPNLSMWLKTGPGPITRSLARLIYRHLFMLEDLPRFSLYDEDVFPEVFRAVEMSYRNDNRDWRIYEQQQRPS